jgi:hypothetical protein
MLPNCLTFTAKYLSDEEVILLLQERKKCKIEKFL